MVTLNYGTGSPQEAAALLAYLNAPVGLSAAIGHGQQWSDSLRQWRDVDWRTADYWAGLRAAAPLAHDDGLNFLRISQPQPFGFHYFEVGNEVYGSWETDRHGQGGDPGRPHDPATYVAFSRQFAALAAAIDSTISIGVDSGSVGYDNNWTRNVLQQGVFQGFTPNFISDHSYMQAPLSRERLISPAAHRLGPRRPGPQQSA
jgi:alpha-L-arabinofuranosidase